MFLYIISIYFYIYCSIYIYVKILVLGEFFFNIIHHLNWAQLLYNIYNLIYFLQLLLFFKSPSSRPRTSFYPISLDIYIVLYIVNYINIVLK